MTTAYDWGLKWTELTLKDKEVVTEDTIYLAAEEVMRDYDLYREEQSLPELTDDEWDDTLYAITEVLSYRY